MPECTRPTNRDKAPANQMTPLVSPQELWQTTGTVSGRENASEPTHISIGIQLSVLPRG